ncbi:hypothetical protein C8Q80DRAFT_1276484 [Daedaleopsis nitida]|nr:hypothetical protein C8Q80DRAFT_1276484 [Daedaleopsis nitida]
MALQLDPAKKGLAQAYQHVVNAAHGTWQWGVSTFNKDTNNLNYGFVRAEHPNFKNAPQPKLVQINWFGSGVEMAKTGQFYIHCGAVTKFLRGAHVVINAIGYYGLAYAYVPRFDSLEDVARVRLGLVKAVLPASRIDHDSLPSAPTRSRSALAICPTTSRRTTRPLCGLVTSLLRDGDAPGAIWDLVPASERYLLKPAAPSGHRGQGGGGIASAAAIAELVVESAVAALESSSTASESKAASTRCGLPRAPGDTVPHPRPARDTPCPPALARIVRGAGRAGAGGASGAWPRTITRRTSGGRGRS